MLYALWNTWTWYFLIAVFQKDWRNSSRTHDFRYRFIRTIFFQSPAWSWTRFYPGSTRSRTLRRNREVARNWIHSGMYLGFFQGTHQNVMSTYILYFTKSGAFTVEKSAWEKGPPPINVAASTAFVSRSTKYVSHQYIWFPFLAQKFFSSFFKISLEVFLPLTTLPGIFPLDSQFCYSPVSRGPLVLQQHSLNRVMSYIGLWILAVDTKSCVFELLYRMF